MSKQSPIIHILVFVTSSFRNFDIRRALAVRGRTIRFNDQSSRRLSLHQTIRGFRRLTSLESSKSLLQTHRDNPIENLQEEIGITKRKMNSNDVNLETAINTGNDYLISFCTKMALSLNNVYAELLAKENKLFDKEKLEGSHQKQVFIRNK